MSCIRTFRDNALYICLTSLDLGGAIKTVKANQKVNLMLNVIFLSFAIGFVISVSLYAPIYFIGNSEITTLSLEIINLQTSGDRKDLAVATTLQMIMPLLMLFIFHLKSKTFIKWSA